jgi:hypothetical protein
MNPDLTKEKNIVGRDRIIVRGAGGQIPIRPIIGGTSSDLHVATAECSGGASSSDYTANTVYTPHVLIIGEMPDISNTNVTCYITPTSISGETSYQTTSSYVNGGCQTSLALYDKDNVLINTWSMGSTSLREDWLSFGTYHPWTGESRGTNSTDLNTVSYLYSWTPVTPVYAGLKLVATNGSFSYSLKLAFIWQPTVV